MEGEGYIKLFRKFTDWEWYGDTPCVRLFLHLLLTANFKDNQWNGTTIKRGQVVTGRLALAEATGLTEKQIRTALDKLEKTGEIERARANKFSIITICKFDTYQQFGETKGQQGASKNEKNGQQKGQQKGQQNEPVINCNTERYEQNDIIEGQQKGQQKGQQNEKKGPHYNNYYNNIIVVDDTRTREEQPKPPAAYENDELINEALSQQIWVETICLKNKIYSMGELQTIIEDFKQNEICNGHTTHLGLEDLKTHLNNYIRKYKERQKNETQRNNAANINGARGIQDKDTFIRSTLQAIQDARRLNKS